MTRVPSLAAALAFATCLPAFAVGESKPPETRADAWVRYTLSSSDFDSETLYCPAKDCGPKGTLFKSKKKVYLYRFTVKGGDSNSLNFDATQAYEAAVVGGKVVVKNGLKPLVSYPFVDPGEKYRVTMPNVSKPAARGKGESNEPASDRQTRPLEPPPNPDPVDTLKVVEAPKPPEAPKHGVDSLQAAFNADSDLKDDPMLRKAVESYLILKGTKKYENELGVQNPCQMELGARKNSEICARIFATHRDTIMQDTRTAVDELKGPGKPTVLDAAQSELLRKQLKIDRAQPPEAVKPGIDALQAAFDADPELKGDHILQISAETYLILEGTKYRQDNPCEIIFERRKDSKACAEILAKHRDEIVRNARIAIDDLATPEKTVLGSAHSNSLRARLSARKIDPATLAQYQKCQRETASPGTWKKELRGLDQAARQGFGSVENTKQDLASADDPCAALRERRALAQDISARREKQDGIGKLLTPKGPLPVHDKKALAAKLDKLENAGKEKPYDRDLFMAGGAAIGAALGMLGGPVGVLVGMVAGAALGWGAVKLLSSLREP